MLVASLTVTLWMAFYIVNVDSLSKLVDLSGSLRPIAETVGNYNDHKLLVYFDTDCVGSKKEAIAGYLLMLEDLGDCLTDDTNFTDNIYYVKKLDQYHAYFELTSTECVDDIDIDYTDYCLSYFDFETLFLLNSGGSNDYTCITDNVAFVDGYTYDLSGHTFDNYWNLGSMDGFGLDFSYDRAIIDNIEDVNVDLFIIDSGVLSTHEEFEDISLIRLAKNFDDSDITSDHGTHCAGIAGGKTAGVAKDITIYDVPSCYYSGYCTGQAVDAGFDWIIQVLESNYVSSTDRRRGVISISWGGTYSSSVMDSYNAIFEYISELGGIMVAATTNTMTEWNEPCSSEGGDGPANADYTITVGNYAWNWEPYSTGYGDCIDIFSPGYSVTSSVSSCDSCYEEKIGTSMATPAVAGLIATMLAIDDSLTFDQILSILQDEDGTTELSNCPNGHTCLATTMTCATMGALIDKYSTRDDSTDTTTADTTTGSGCGCEEDNMNDYTSVVLSDVIQVYFFGSTLFYDFNGEWTVASDDGTSCWNDKQYFTKEVYNIVYSVDDTFLMAWQSDTWVIRKEEYSAAWAYCDSSNLIDCSNNWVVYGTTPIDDDCSVTVSSDSDDCGKDTSGSSSRSGGGSSNNDSVSYENGNGELKWWVWLLISIAVIVSLLAVIVGVVVWKHKRKHMEEGVGMVSLSDNTSPYKLLPN